MTILGTEPDTEQIVVDVARGFRYAAADGTYDKMLALLTHRRDE